MTELLRIDNLRAGYCEAVVLPALSFDLAQRKTLALFGRNGMGKTTLLKSIIGVATHHGGHIFFAGEDITQLRADERAGAGIGWVPQGRHIFKSLTVEENIAAVQRPGIWSLKSIYALFPRLAERRLHFGNQLSGGEQQMLAIARALAVNPRLLLLDEPLEGLAPMLADEVLGLLQRIVREGGVAAIIAEQNPARLLPMADEAAVIDRGTIVYRESASLVAADSAILEAHLGLSKMPDTAMPMR